MTRKSPRRFTSPALKAIHSSASALLKVGAIAKATMRDFDESCLATPPALAPRQIKRLRALKMLAVVQKHGLEILG